MDTQKDTKKTDNQIQDESSRGKLNAPKIALDGPVVGTGSQPQEPLVSKNLEIVIEGPVLSAKRVNTTGRIGQIKNVPTDTLTDLEPISMDELLGRREDSSEDADSSEQPAIRRKKKRKKRKKEVDGIVIKQSSGWSRFLARIKKWKIIKFLFPNFAKEKVDVEAEKEVEDILKKEETIEDEIEEIVEEVDDGIITPGILAVDYRYVKLLGEGANGRTWLAKDRRNGLDVAIKELKFVDDFKAFDLFQREAETLKTVNVIGVPKFIANITDGMTSYIVQEYIPYPSLDNLLDQKHVFNEEEIYTILDEVSKILFALQTRYVPAIIHRDVKPGNILYRRAKGNESAKVWLIDFGAVDNAHKQTSGSTIAGTFGYCAPEQLQGEVSPRVDFYGLGTTALHLLTGVFPYEIPVELFQLQFHPVIEAKAPHTTKPLIDLLDSLLASNPEDRPQDATKLREAILHAQEMSSKYRQIIRYEIQRSEPTTALGKWFRSTSLGSSLYEKNLARKQAQLDKKYDSQIKQLEWMEKKEAEAREALERRRQAELKASGVECVCKARRISVYRSYNLLEGIFMYEGNWYPAYIKEHDPGIEVRDARELPPKSIDVVNTFKVIFKPGASVLDSYASLVRPQTIWLDDELGKFRRR